MTIQLHLICKLNACYIRLRLKHDPRIMSQDSQSDSCLLFTDLRYSHKFVECVSKMTTEWSLSQSQREGVGVLVEGEN